MTLPEYLSKRGKTAELARALHLTHTAVRRWNGKPPAERVIEVETATGIPREELRPDLYRRGAKAKDHDPAPVA